MIPKSIAPRLIRLASMPNIRISEIANNRERGITDATTSPERKLPNNRTTTNITIRHPKIRFSATVKVVLATSSLRSKKALMYTPSGKAFCTSSTRSFIALMVSLESAPLSIII